VSVEENEALVRRSIRALDDNQSSDWSVIDESIAEDFVAHNPPLPGVSLDREGMKQAAEIFRSTGRSPTSHASCGRSASCAARTTRRAARTAPGALTM
jgi:hypothetical protein